MPNYFDELPADQLPVAGVDLQRKFGLLPDVSGGIPAGSELPAVGDANAAMRTSRAVMAPW